MVTFAHKISDVNGLHARNAMSLVLEVRKLNSRIYVSCKGRKADAGQIMNLMGLAARCGDELIFTVEGRQETDEAQILEKQVGKIL